MMLPFRFYGQFDPPVDRILYERYFVDRTVPGICLECGAADGVNLSSTKFFEESLGWRSINIEALPRYFDLLVKNRPNATNICAALTDQEGPQYLNDHHLTSRVVPKGTRHALTVQGTTYRKVVEQLGIDRLDLMVLDVEFHEEAALAGMVGSPVMPDIFCVEANAGRNDIIVGLVTAMGYTLDYTFKVNRFFRRNG